MKVSAIRELERAAIIATEGGVKFGEPVVGEVGMGPAELNVVSNIAWSINELKRLNGLLDEI